MIRIANIIALIIAAALAVTLYRAKSHAKMDQENIDALRAEIAQREESLRVLRAQISYLEDEERLEALAREHLGLQPLDPLRAVTLDEAPLMLATQPAPLDAPALEVRHDEDGAH